MISSGYSEVVLGEECDGNCMYKVYIKLKRLKPDLKALNQKHYSRFTAK